MTDAKIGKITKVPLREIWRREDTNFTKWLEENIDYLTDVLGFDLSIESREKSVGPFSVDLYGEDEHGGKVIIENQLEKTDHTHLGQIITYLTNLDAKTAIWITSEPVEQHEKAFDWLNEVTADDIAFYLVKLEAIKIGDESTVAPLFTVVKRPNSVIKQIGAAKKESAHIQTLRHEFWMQFIDKINEKNSICENVEVSHSNYLRVATVTRGIPLYLVITDFHARLEVYIDTGKKEQNKKIFDYLFAKKDEVESVYQNKLIWQRLDNNRISKIEIVLRKVSAYKKEDWEKMTSFLIDNTEKMHKVFVQQYAEEIKNL